MTIYIESEQEALQELDEALEVIEVTEAIRRACRVNISDLINPNYNEVTQ